MGEVFATFLGQLLMKNGLYYNFFQKNTVIFNLKNWSKKDKSNKDVLFSDMSFLDVSFLVDVLFFLDTSTNKDTSFLTSIRPFVHLCEFFSETTSRKHKNCLGHFVYVTQFNLVTGECFGPHSFTHQSLEPPKQNRKSKTFLR